MDLLSLGNRAIQGAVRHNLVSFPAGALVFPRQSRTDLQWRIAVLYFVRGWSFSAIARRYGLTHERIGQIARDWRKASIAAGYIQEIPADPFVNSCEPSLPRLSSQSPSASTCNAANSA